VSADEGSSSPLFEVIAYQFEKTASFFEALADPDRGGGSVEPETNTDEAERPIRWTEIVNCMDEGARARKACIEAGGTNETCYVTGALAEAECLKQKLKELEKK
jgi:hypothetical protein